MEIVVSKTGEGELLIYKEYETDCFRNIVIDEDGDIELMIIPKDRSKTKNKLNVTVDEALHFLKTGLIEDDKQ